MAKANKKSSKASTKWFQSLTSKSVLALVVIAIFSIGGAAYLQGSHAAVYFVRTVDYTKMSPSAGTGSPGGIPKTVVEQIGNYNQKTVYNLPGVLSGSSVWVSTVMPDQLVKGVSYRACAMVRRDQAAGYEKIELSLSLPFQSTPLSKASRDLPGSINYERVCGDAYKAPSTIAKSLIIYVTNPGGSLHAARVASIDLEMAN